MSFESLNQVPSASWFSIADICRKKLILTLRGGLGNQLFQIAALVSFSQRTNAKPFIFDLDSRQNPRDNFVATSLDFDLNKWFSREQPVRIIREPLESVIRYFRGIERRMLVDGITKMDAINTSLPGLSFLSGYFEDKQYPQSLPTFNLDSLFPTYVNREKIRMSHPINDSIAMHVRLTDFKNNPSKVLPISYYLQAIKAFSSSFDDEIHCYTDNIMEAEQLFREAGIRNITFVEHSRKYSAPELLFRLSCYSKIICSKSTLCWWSTYLATLANPQTKVFCAWDDKLRLDSWSYLPSN